MKILPCKTKCFGQPALAKKSGELQTTGSISSSSIVYMCKRCGLPSRITSAEFHSLPDTDTATAPSANADSNVVH